ncbi:hypothetical protein PAECIP111893_01647 [Paenibacillus plantiphilus]|uniref:DALR anticodon binding domain-containing protein n=1 Tax=Paenibacillus plantiphilus TaxID=2905650 RepID=A0ABM9C1G5_9BACL|nr:hypothetical protein [Paenibacillus plantiphilus]CAH1201537.1 hypothetical protein PAECIP111893_01647 [Paenibacillus plantiphilus]
MIKINKDKNIGKVLLIVEGLRTEFYLLHKIFTRIFNFQYEKLDRMLKYGKFNEQEGIQSSVFVINTKESAISFIKETDEFLDSMFEKLIEEYQFPVDRAAIFYVFDRDVKSNTDSVLIRDLIRSLSSSRENNGFFRQGLLLLSYPCVESFVASNFIENSFELSFETGDELKQYLNNQKINQSKITEDSIKMAVTEMENALKQLGVAEYSLDHFSDTNLFIFNLQEEHYIINQKYRLLSLLCLILLDLGLIEVIDFE